MAWLLIMALAVVICFAVAILLGAPYLPTLKEQTVTAINLLDLAAGQTLIELGSGDGRVLLAAAKRGIRGIGYEVNPIMVLVGRIVTWRYRHLIDIYWRDIWRIKLPRAEGVYVFLLKRHMKKLDKKIAQECPYPIKVVSFAFAFDNHVPVAEQSGVMLYELGKRQ